MFSLKLKKARWQIFLRQNMILSYVMSSMHPKADLILIDSNYKKIASCCIKLKGNKEMFQLVLYCCKVYNKPHLKRWTFIECYKAVILSIYTLLYSSNISSLSTFISFGTSTTRLLGSWAFWANQELLDAASCCLRKKKKIKKRSNFMAR